MSPQLIEKELSYQVIGILFDVYNELGGGYQEKYYQRAIARVLNDKGIKFKEQVQLPLSYKGEVIGRYFIDFLIEGKIVLEIKATNKLYFRDIKQVLAYLKSANIELGILAGFNKKGLIYKRILKGKN